LLFFSLAFYAYGAPDFILILLASSTLNFHIVKWMDKVQSEKLKKLICALSVMISLSLLLYFKYANFFVDNINRILGLMHHHPIAWVKVLLPIGISFFTFQSITYTIDVYRKTTPHCEKLTNYILYIIMFPQLIAGPIVLYSSVAAELIKRNSEMEDRVLGFYRFIIGLSKKVLIANTLAQVADQVFAMDYLQIGSGVAWVGILSYTFQIYFDFSGYSDMAIGLGKMMGFNFPENFMNPYTSQSISEFWRRWHMTLGLFMKDYLYIPLGGNRGSKARTYLNLAIVFLCSGFWHGASFNFILWGAFHGFFLIMDRVFMMKLLKKIGKIPSVILTFFIVNLGWVLFRIEDLSGAWNYYQSLFAFRNGFSVVFTERFWFFFVLAIFFSFITMSKKGQRVQDLVFANTYTIKRSRIMFVVALLLLILSAGSLAVSDFNPFIYFRF
jgi:Predicted membrane protein involved in D-alanine export